MSKTEKLRKIIFIFWIFLIIFCLSFYFLNPELFNPYTLKNIFSDNLFFGLMIYFIISTLRGFTLIPSTPIVLAGILFFPPVELFFVNLLAVFTSSTIVFYFSEFMEFGKFFEKRYSRQMEKLKRLLKNKEIPIITLWGFFPAIPTDMIVYICNIIKIKLWKCLIGVAIGEATICAIYIYYGHLAIMYFF